jgi:hypothetical protein
VKTSTLYASSDLTPGVREQLRAAQIDIDRHVTSCATGMCLECGRVGPCPVNERASSVFARLGRLPRRVPGASHPEVVGARRVGGPGLLARAG